MTHILIKKTYNLAAERDFRPRNSVLSYFDLILIKDVARYEF